jgi:circadian clock protein KaiB
MSPQPTTTPETQSLGLFKGIALFTPGGDLVYCIDPYKQNHWHLQLCAVVQEILGLAEPPHFLVPCYTATVDRWLDPQTQQVKTVAEACPLVLKHQALLNAIFGTGSLTWSRVRNLGELCNPIILSSYRQEFPQLWEDHDLIVQFENMNLQGRSRDPKQSTLSWSPIRRPKEPQGYVLRLFVSGHNAATKRILHHLHQLLETSLQQPYTLKVIDIYKHPELAEADQIAATPTLMKIYPRPVRRIVGDLDDTSKILQLLSSSSED